jgi:hypothetical protein
VVTSNHDWCNANLAVDRSIDSSEINTMNSTWYRVWDEWSTTWSTWGRFMIEVETLGVRQHLGAPTTMWGFLGASFAGPTWNRQPDVEDSKAGGMGEELSAPSGVNFACHCYCIGGSARGTKKRIPW